VVLILASIILSASPGPGAAAVPLRYCVVTIVESATDGKLQAKIDYGQDATTPNSKVLDDKGKALEFETEQQMLNWMNSEGWDFISVFNKPGEPGPGTHFLMRKKLKH